MTTVLFPTLFTFIATLIGQGTDFRPDVPPFYNSPRSGLRPKTVVTR